MATHPSHAQQEIRRLRRQFLRRNWPALTLFALFVVATSVALVGFEDLFARWIDPRLVTGFILGVGAATAVALVVTLLGADGSRTYREGREAEDWTASELNRRRKEGWSVFRNLQFEDKDIDHILIGPRGAVVVETKRRNQNWTITSTSIEDAHHHAVPWTSDLVNQATRHARTLRSLLFAGGVRTEVRPVIVLWGPDITGAPAATIDGVLVGRGNAIDDWFDQVESSPLSEEQIALATRAILTLQGGMGVGLPRPASGSARSSKVDGKHEGSLQQIAAAPPRRASGGNS
jgi:hypothetical protein